MSVLTALAMRNLATEIQRTTPRSDWIVLAILELADDLHNFASDSSLRDANAAGSPPLSQLSAATTPVQ